MVSCTPSCDSAVLGVPIGSNCSYGFVFKDEAGAPVDLSGAQFILTATAKYPRLALEFTTSEPATLYVQENVNITPVDRPAYIADWLVLSLTPDVTRQIPLGSLTAWEIERRKDGEQHNWGSGMFRGYGGINPDTPLAPPAPLPSGETLCRFSLADDDIQSFPIPAISAGDLVRVDVWATDSASFDWFAAMLVDGAAATIVVELGIVKNVTVQLSAAIGVSDPNGSLNIALDVPGQVKIRNRTGAPAEGVVRITI